MAYIDGFIVPVPKTNIAAYREFATRAGKIWKEYGALEFHECRADDVQPGELTSFPQSVDMKPGETVFFSWIVHESRKQLSCGLDTHAVFACPRSGLRPV